MKKLSKIDESVWSDMEDRGTGVRIKEEDKSNIDELKPVDMGGTVYWADRDLAIQGDTKLTYEQVERAIVNSEWRLPRAFEVDELETYSDDDNNFYFKYPLQKLVFPKDKSANYDVYHGWVENDGVGYFLNAFSIEPGSIDTDVVRKPADRECARLVMDKKKNESVWTDMEERGTGDLLKKEDEHYCNLKALKPVDIGCSVLWAEDDLIIDDERLFLFDDVNKFISGSGWRLPTRTEVWDMINKKGGYWVGQDSYEMLYPDKILNKNIKLIFKKSGMIYNTSVSHGHNMLSYPEEYWGWTSEECESDRSQIHCYNMRSSNGKFEIECSKLQPRNMFDTCSTDRTAKCCVRLVRDK